MGAPGGLFGVVVVVGVLVGAAAAGVEVGVLAGAWGEGRQGSEPQGVWKRDVMLK